MYRGRRYLGPVRGYAHVVCGERENRGRVFPQSELHLQSVVGHQRVPLSQAGGLELVHGSTHEIALRADSHLRLIHVVER